MVLYASLLNMAQNIHTLIFFALMCLHTLNKEKLDLLL